ncbi:MAG: hypothetical protein M3459_01385, partial [Actinomycetota bacterium]|nr:hypothetical protein [Actinomycetota bacterium]
MSQRGEHKAGPQEERPWETINPWEHAEVRLGPRRLLELMRPALRLVWRASPSETINLVAMQTLAGFALPAQVLAGTWALDSILDASRSGAGMTAA